MEDVEASEVSTKAFSKASMESMKVSLKAVEVSKIAFMSLHAKKK